MSELVLRIKKIAEEEGDVISEDTLKQFDIPTLPQAQDEVETIKKVTEIIKTVTEYGAKIPPLAPYLGPISKIAGYILKFINWADPEEDKPDPVLTALGELKVALNELSDKMTSHFEDLKSFIVENDFYRTYTTTINKLFFYMMDTMTDRRQNAIDAFARAYEKDWPFDLVYQMLAMLQNDATNPLLWAMNTDELKTKTTFSKWAENLRSIVMESLLLEAFASGLLFEGDEYKMDKVLEKAALLEDRFKEWHDFYCEKSFFWPAPLKKAAQKVLEDKSLKKEEEKLEKIREIVDDLVTSHNYMVFIYDKATAIVPYNDNMGFHVFHEKLTISICRNNTHSRENFDEMKREVKSLNSLDFIRPLIAEPLIAGIYHLKQFWSSRVKRFPNSFMIISLGKPLKFQNSQFDGQNDPFFEHIEGNLLVRSQFSHNDFVVHYYVVG